mgnify:CR=1 FL=1
MRAQALFKQRLLYIPFTLTLLGWLVVGHVLSGATTREDILLAHWKLDETTGTTAKDASANEKDGTLKNRRMMVLVSDAILSQFAIAIKF